jgi:hypothetical protein
MTTNGLVRCKGQDCTTLMLEGADGGLRDDRPGYCSTCSCALDMIEKMKDNNKQKRKRSEDKAEEEEDAKEQIKKKQKTAEEEAAAEWMSFFGANNNRLVTNIIDKSELFPIQEVLPWPKPEPFPCGLLLPHGPCTLCGIAVEQQRRKKKQQEETEAKEDKKEKEDRLEGQRPCQGGRYREFPNGDTIIQCNCNFFCTSAIDGKTRKRRVLPKLPKGQFYPYYYDCPEKDKIPGWDPWHTPKKEDNNNGSKQGSSSSSGGSGIGNVIALCIVMFVILAGNPLVVGATITRGPEPRRLIATEVCTIDASSFAPQEPYSRRLLYKGDSVDGTCDNLDQQVPTAFDFVAFKYQLETFRKMFEKEELERMSEHDVCMPYEENCEPYFEEIQERVARAAAETEKARQKAAEQERNRRFDDLLESIEVDRLLKEREAVTSDDNPINPYVEQFLYSTTEADRLLEEQQAKIDEIRKFNDIVQKQIHELHFRTEQVLVATENAIRANDEVIRHFTGPEKLTIVLLWTSILLPVLILQDLHLDPDAKRMIVIIKAMQVCYTALILCNSFLVDWRSEIVGDFVHSPVITCPVIVLYLVLWLRAVVRGGCVPHVNNVW